MPNRTLRINAGKFQSNQFADIRYFNLTCFSTTWSFGYNICCEQQGLLCPVFVKECCIFHTSCKPSWKGTSANIGRNPKSKWTRFAELDTCYVTVRVNRTEMLPMQGNSTYFVLPRYCICYCVCIESLCCAYILIVFVFANSSYFVLPRWSVCAVVTTV